MAVPELSTAVGALWRRHPASAGRYDQLGSNFGTILDNKNTEHLTYFVYDKETEDMARASLGPLACLGSTVWVNVAFGKDMK